MVRKLIGLAVVSSALVLALPVYAGPTDSSTPGANAAPAPVDAAPQANGAANENQQVATAAQAGENRDKLEPTENAAPAAEEKHAKKHHKHAHHKAHHHAKHHHKAAPAPAESAAPAAPEQQQ